MAFELRMAYRSRRRALLHGAPYSAAAATTLIYGCMMTAAVDSPRYHDVSAFDITLHFECAILLPHLMAMKGSLRALRHYNAHIPSQSHRPIAAAYRKLSDYRRASWLAAIVERHY